MIIKTRKKNNIGFSNRFNTVLRLRNLQNKTLAELAQLFDVSRTTIHKWMHFDNVPSVDVADKICEILNINFYWFLTGKGEMLLVEKLTKDETAILLMYKNLKPDGQRKICKVMFTEYAGFEVMPRTKVENQRVLKLIPATDQD